MLSPGDTILVIAPMEPLLELEALNQPAHEAFARVWEKLNNLLADDLARHHDHS